MMLFLFALLGTGGLFKCEVYALVVTPAPQPSRGDTAQPEKDWVGSSIGLEPEAQANWELQMSHNDVYDFSCIKYNATGKRTQSKNLDVRGTEVNVLSDLVPMFCTCGCTTLFVHACMHDQCTI